MFVNQQQPYNPNIPSFQRPQPGGTSHLQKSNAQQVKPKFWALPSDGRARRQNVIPQQSLSSTNLNVQQLSQDLLKLKEQLKKLAERGEEIGANRVKAEEVQSARMKVQPNNQNHLRPNVSADQHALRRNPINSNLIYYPQIPAHHSIVQDVKPSQNLKQNNEQQEANSKTIELPPSKRQKIYSFMQNKEPRPSRAVPFTNSRPNENQSNRINVQLRLELQIKELKDRLLKAQEQLKASNQEKQKLSSEIDVLKQANLTLKNQVDSRKQSSISQPVPQQTYEQEQKKASLIIEKLQAEIQNLKSSNRVSFDEVLKSQLQENKILKSKLNEKIYQLQQIKDQWNHEKKTNESLKSELTIQEMKASTELRGRQIKLQIQLSDKANQLQTAKRALQTLDLKYRASLNQIREKDDFIMNYMVGRAKQNEKEDIRKALEQYKITFPQNRSVEGLLKEQKEIEQLKKEVQRLKGK